MGVEYNVPEVVKAAIEKAVIGYAPFDDYMDSGNGGDDCRIMEFQAKIIDELTKHLAPAIIVLIAEVRWQDVVAVCEACRSKNPIVLDSKGRRAHEYETLDDPQFGRSEIALCRADPIHDLRKADEKAE